jgi:hypothetical protein
MKQILSKFYLVILIALSMMFSNCAAQHKHHKAVPCPCEKNNKR